RDWSSDVCSSDLIPSVGAYRSIWLAHCLSFTSAAALPPPCSEIYRLRPSRGFSPNTLNSKFMIAPLGWVICFCDHCCAACSWYRDFSAVIKLSASAPTASSESTCAYDQTHGSIKEKSCTNRFTIVQQI